MPLRRRAPPPVRLDGDLAVGPGADADKLEELASFLESQGICTLAQRYREQAFQQRLGDKPTGDEEDDDGEPEAAL